MADQYDFSDPAVIRNLIQQYPGATFNPDALSNAAAEGNAEGIKLIIDQNDQYNQSFTRETLDAVLLTTLQSELPMGEKLAIAQILLTAGAPGRAVPGQIVQCDSGLNAYFVSYGLEPSKFPPVIKWAIETGVLDTSIGISLVVGAQLRPNPRRSAGGPSRSSAGPRTTPRSLTSQLLAGISPSTARTSPTGASTSPPPVITVAAPITQ